MFMSSLTATRQVFASPGKTLALGLSLVLTWPLSLSAQIVRGQVVDSVLGTPVPAVAVVLVYQAGGEVARTVTDEAGLFLLRAPGAGQYHLRAHGDGHRLSDFPPFDLAADGMLAYRLLVPSVNPPSPTQEPDAGGVEMLVLPNSALRMRPVATELAPVTVTAEAPRNRRNLAEFERRRATTTGSFITRAEFVRHGNPRKTTDVLRRMRGIRVRPGTGFLMTWIITSTRGARAVGVNTAGECSPLIFLDRRFIGTAAALVVDNVIPVEQIEAIEFYSSIAGMPPEFNRRGAVCGVLVFWTR